MSWLDTPGSAPGIGQADIDRALAAGRSMSEIQAEINRAQGAGVAVGTKAQSYATSPITSYTYPEFQAAQTAAELQTRSSISNYGWDAQKAMENIRQAAETERLKYEIDNRIPVVQAETKGRIDLQKIINSGERNIARIQRGSDMVRNITSMFNF